MPKPEVNEGNPPMTCQTGLFDRDIARAADVVNKISVNA
jgi:hypothetical protein